MDFQVALVRNELIKSSACQLLKVAIPFVRVSLHRRVNRHTRQQARLRIRYGIKPDTPITSWDVSVQENVDRVSTEFSDIRYAFTSGSTSKPKRIPYTSKRLRNIKRASFEAVLQVAQTYNIKSPTLFVLAAMQKDDSLSNLLLEQESPPSFFSGLVMPSKYIGHPGLTSVVMSYGPMAVRLCLLVISNPAILYGTNPSTLASFFNSVEHNWIESSRLLRDMAVNPNSVCPKVRKVLRNVVTRGWQDRVKFAASATELPDLQDLVPGLRCFCCWDGGYVRPFLNTIRNYLLADRYVHVPMYSMSTECLQTQTVFANKSPHYLPIAPDVLYEFLPEGSAGDPSCLLATSELEEGQSYCMVVSDPYGLSRYQTDDVFLCVDKVEGLPDLRFVRRRGLVYSFTGEKITGQQIEAVYAQLQKNYPLLQKLGAQMTLIPAFSEAESQRGRYPHYRLVVAHTAKSPLAVSAQQFSVDFDRSLAAQNPEFASKRTSGRLGPTAVLFVNYDRFACLMKKNDSPDIRTWDNQFKLVPLFTKRWDELGLPPFEDLL